jgi:hypothetical protein
VRLSCCLSSVRLVIVSALMRPVLEVIRMERVDLPFMPDEGEFLEMVLDVVKLLGEREAAQWFNCSVSTVRHWREGFMPDWSGIRSVWFTWCLLLHPHKLSSAFHVLTWGRFADEADEQVQVDGAGWSGWSI